jgi:hypothetical protein
MNIKTLAALAISVTALSAAPAFADEHGWHGRGGGNGSHWSHDDRDHGGYRGGYDHDRWYGHDRWNDRHEAYRAPRWAYEYAPRYEAPRYCPPRYYAPTAYYAPAYYAPAYVEPVHRGGWIDDLGVVVQLHLP